MSKAFDDWFSKRYPTTQDTLNPPQITNLVTLLTEAWQAGAQAALAKQNELIVLLKQEAQIHAQEAKTANSTIYEIYQCVTGATGEPGNWHGAEPVRAALAAKDADYALGVSMLTKKIAALTAERDTLRKDAA
jgi:hypothetical protein